MKFQQLQKEASTTDIQELRKKCDCIMFDLKKLQTDDSFIVNDDSFDIRQQPLHLVVIELKDLNRNWSILNDRFRRNTMIIASDEDVRSNPAISSYLESQGVALLMCKSSDDGRLCLESLTKSLSSLKFKSILIEDKIDLIKEFQFN
jgi:riboflavin biosynthesis pyrimidine reductase